MKDYIPYVLCGMLMYMCCMTYQIFIYCWHGNELYLHVCNCFELSFNEKEQDFFEQNEEQNVIV